MGHSIIVVFPRIEKFPKHRRGLCGHAGDVEVNQSRRRHGRGQRRDEKQRGAVEAATQEQLWVAKNAVWTHVPRANRTLPPTCRRSIKSLLRLSHSDGNGRVRFWWWVGLCSSSGSGAVGPSMLQQSGQHTKGVDKRLV
jgi:hypothetical protein